jgi:hypothetical protein
VVWRSGKLDLAAQSCSQATSQARGIDKLELNLALEAQRDLDSIMLEASQIAVRGEHMTMYISHERVAGRDCGFDETKRLIFTTREEKSANVLINELPDIQHRSILSEMVGAGKLCWEGGFN